MGAIRHGSRPMALVAFAVLVIGTGCARRTTVVRTQTTAEYPVVEAQTSAPVVKERTTTTTTQEVHHDEEPRGVLSTAVHVVGEIIALPFRLVGALLRAIF